MTSVFQARRRAEEFAAAVDGRPGGGRVHGEEVAGLLLLVESLRDEAHADVAPRAEFAADLRSRLLREAESALRPEHAKLVLPAREHGRRERRLVAAATAFVLVGGTTTMAAAAQNALPGEALYPIKRGIELADVSLSTNPADKGQDLLGQASGRLSEVEGLLEVESAAEPRVPETLEAFTLSAREGASLLFESYAETDDESLIVEVREFAAEGIETIEGLAAGVPREAAEELNVAAVALSEIDGTAMSLCPSCAADLPVVEVPPLIPARAEVDLALEAVAGKELNNDHPVNVPQEVIPGSAEPSTGASEAGGAEASEAATSVAPSSPATTAPTEQSSSPSVTPSPSESPGSSLPAVPAPETFLTTPPPPSTSVPSPTGEVTEKLNEGLETGGSGLSSGTPSGSPLLDGLVSGLTDSPTSLLPETSGPSSPSN